MRLIFHLAAFKEIIELVLITQIKTRQINWLTCLSVDVLKQFVPNFKLLKRM